MDVQVNTIIRAPANIARDWRSPPRGQAHTHCGNCPSRAQCLPGSLEPHEIKQFEHIINGRHSLQAGEPLFGECDRSSSIYAVRSGTLKLVQHSIYEQKHISGFAFPGDILLGYDSFGTGSCGSDAIAVDNAMVCEIPFEALSELGEVLPNLLSACLQMISRRIITEQKFAKLLTEGSANQRVSRFLLMMSDDFNPDKRSAGGVTVPMNREDIGNYLRLPVQTLNSLLDVFEKHGLISINDQEYFLLDHKSLREMAYGHSCTDRTSKRND